MTREEILEKSRQDNRKQDEREKAAFAKAGQRACAVGAWSACSSSCWKRSSPGT